LPFDNLAFSPSFFFDSAEQAKFRSVPTWFLCALPRLAGTVLTAVPSTTATPIANIRIECLPL